MLQRSLGVPRAPTVTYNTDRLAANLVTAGRLLVPGTSVYLLASVARLARNHNHLSKHQLGNTPSVGVRSIEDRDTVTLGSEQISLIRANAEAPNTQQ